MVEAGAADAALAKAGAHAVAGAGSLGGFTDGGGITAGQASGTGSAVVAPKRNWGPRRSGSCSPTKVPPFLAHNMRIKVANRILVYCGASGRTGKPMP